MISIFDAMVTVDSNHCAITRVYKGNHAALIIEMEHPDSRDREVRYAHFLPDSVRHATSQVDAIIITLDQFLSEKEKGKVEQKIYHGVTTAADLRSRIGLRDCSSETYCIQKSSATTMVDTILAEYHKSVNVPDFHIRGIAYSSQTFNCRSWVREKLAMVNVNIPKNWCDQYTSDTLNSENYQACRLL